MLCPLCARALRPVERQGVEMDHCPQCGGIWLDQGELNELIRREAVAAFQRGEDALAAARRDREYDRAVATDGVETFRTSRGLLDGIEGATVAPVAATPAL